MAEGVRGGVRGLTLALLLLCACGLPEAREGGLEDCAQLLGARQLPREEDGLPVLHLYLAGSLPDGDEERPARLVHGGRCDTLEVKPRGATSRAFPRRSYTLDFPEQAPFVDERLGAGAQGRRKVVLIAPFNDNSYLRHRLAFTLWSWMSPAHLQVRTARAVVDVDGAYQGLYVVADHVDRHSLAAQGQDPAGQLFKAVSAEANFSRRSSLGERKRSLGEGYEKKEGLPEEGPGAFAPIAELTAFVDGASEAQFRAQRGAWMDPADYEDWWIFSTLVRADDASAKNAYHHRGTAPGARWRFIPWDLDATLGQDWRTYRVRPEARPDLTGFNTLFARMLADPAIAGPLRERYRALLQGPLHVERVLALIDQYAAEVAAAARRDEAHWGEAYRTFPHWAQRTDLTSHEGEVQYLRDWVRAHWRALEEGLP